MAEVVVNCMIVGQWSFFSLRFDEAPQVAILKDRIGRKNPQSVRCEPHKLQLFLAKQGNVGEAQPPLAGGNWLTEDNASTVELIDGRPARCRPMKASEWLQNDYLDKGVDLDKTKLHVLVVIPEPRWKEAAKPTYALSDGSLYFVNREGAVEQLQNIHRSVYLGATRAGRGDDWQIALADNERGLGKSTFGKEYIRRCREQWPEPSTKFQELLCASHTIALRIERSKFVDAAIKCKDASDWSIAFKRALNADLATAVMDQLDFPDGAQVPSYLTKPEDKDIVEDVVRDFGPVFIVLDEVGQGFVSADHSDAAEEHARTLFIEFCMDVLQNWMETKGAFFVLLGYAPFLRNVEERKNELHISSSKFTFVRLKLQLIRPEKIKDIIRNTRIAANSSTTIKQQWGLTTEEALGKAAEVMFKKTCGHPRTMFAVFKKYKDKPFKDVLDAQVNPFDSTRGSREWATIYRELRNWQLVLKTTFLPSILEKTPIRLDHDYDGLMPPRGEGPQKHVSFFLIMERCEIGWEGTIEEATLHALPTITAAIIGIVQNLREYIETIESIVDDVTLAYATVWEWAFLKRFQELFSEPCKPCEILPQFFGANTVFGRFENVQFPGDVVDLPQITSSAGPRHVKSISLGLNSMNPSNWPHLMDEIVSTLKSRRDGCLSLKPLPQSFSVDVILMKRNVCRENQSPPVGQKRARSNDGVETLTVGLTVKNYSKSTKFGEPQLADECKKFNAMFEGLDNAEFGGMTNVLIVCATKYTPELLKSFGNDKYATYENEAYPHITEIVLLNLSTPENRAEFFGLSDDTKLADALNNLLDKTERERDDRLASTDTVALGR